MLADHAALSRPAAPASARKDRVPAVKRSGRVFSSTMLSRTRLVSGTSAVGIKPKRPLLMSFSCVPARLARQADQDARPRRRSAAQNSAAHRPELIVLDFGNCAVPNIAASRTKTGGDTST